MNVPGRFQTAAGGVLYSRSNQKKSLPIFLPQAVFYGACKHARFLLYSSLLCILVVEVILFYFLLRIARCLRNCAFSFSLEILFSRGPLTCFHPVWEKWEIWNSEPYSCLAIWFPWLQYTNVVDRLPSSLLLLLQSKPVGERMSRSRVSLIAIFLSASFETHSTFTRKNSILDICK